jgi:hypothetical protein
MTPEQRKWRPVSVGEIPSILGDFEDWCLCGGHSVDLLVGRKTRDHGDIDIAVLRSGLSACLSNLGPGQVFLCNPLRAWDGKPVPPEVHDIWIADKEGECWILQIMIFEDDGDDVVYRRDPRISWSKNSHSIRIGGVRILNPAITQLFKCNQSEMQDKDAKDIRVLIEETANQAVQPTRKLAADRRSHAEI